MKIIILSKIKLFLILSIIVIYACLVFFSDKACVGLGAARTRICFEDSPVTFIFVFISILFVGLLLLLNYIQFKK